MTAAKHQVKRLVTKINDAYSRQNQLPFDPYFSHNPKILT